MEANDVAPEFDIVLASASPRRRELLEGAGLRFRVLSADVDESLEDDLLRRPEEAVKKLAERKAHGAVEALLVPDYVGDLVVLGADTMVVLDGEIFGKPVDADQARSMLQRLSGRAHQVLTGVSIWVVHAPEGQDLGLFYRTVAECATVRFRDLSDQEIDAYIATGDPFDKAGAYGIQSPHCDFVASVEGDVDTVIGLPTARVLELLEDLGACCGNASSGASFEPDQRR